MDQAVQVSCIDYQKQLKQFLENAPGSSNYNEDTFDIDAYKQRCLLLKKAHEEARVSIAGKRSDNEASWNWTPTQWIMFLMSPINLSKLAQ